MTIRRACAALHFDRSTYHYQSRRTDPAFLKKRIKEICETHVRYGYRRVYYILRRDGWHVNLKKVIGFTGSWVSSSATRRPSGGLRRSCARTARRRFGRTMCGQWTSCTTTGDGSQAAHPDGGRHVPTAIARDRSAVQLPWRGRGHYTGTGMPEDRLSEDDQGGQWQRVYLSGHGSVGLPARCDPRLLPPWQAHRQCVHRGVQQQAAQRMPERALVPVAARCLRKAGGLA